MDLGELLDDPQLKEKLLNLHSSIDQIEAIVETGLNRFNYEELSEVDKINYDLFNSYALNILCWMYLRTKGQDPNKTSVKNELNRIKDYMLKAKEVQDKSKMPKINKGAAERFIKHGINYSKSDNSVSKKRKYSEVQ